MTELGRTYPVRNEVTIARLQRDYATKVEKNRLAGIKAFTEGTYKPYSGIPLESTAIFWYALEFTPDSQKQLYERVVDPLAEIARKHDIPALFVGKNYLPPHVSLQGGIYKNITSEQREVIEAWLSSKYSYVRALSEILTGLHFTLDTLVMAPDSYICKGEFDQSQGSAYRIRKAVESIMEKSVKKLDAITQQASLTPPYSYDDIFHCTVSRITGKASSDRLLAFAHEAYEQIQPGLTEKPLDITVANVIQGSSLPFYQKYAPQFIR